jgi:TonB family protein
MINFLIINGVLIVLYLFYKLINKKIGYNQSRITLILLSVISVLVVLVNVNLSATYQVSIPVFELDEFQLTNEINKTATSSYSIWMVLYGIGFTVTLLLFLYKLMSVQLFFRNKEYVKQSGVLIYSSLSKESFSFFNKIHINTGLTPQERDIVIEHESRHSSYLHSLDVIVINMLQLVFWFNPIFILMKRDLNRIHEFQVDADLYRIHKDSYIKTLLRYSLNYTDSHLLLTSPFYPSINLAKRTKNMKNSIVKNPKWMLVIPLVAVMLSVISCAKKEEKVMLTPEQMKNNNVTMPEFKGGSEAMFKYLGENIKYPAQAQADEIEGVVYVGFVVLDDGKVEDVTVKRGVNELLDAAAVKTIKEMPNWEPGTFEGENATIQMVLPINFSLK